MNERIQKLIAQATRIEEPDGLFPREVFDKEKFAELIVRECIRVSLWYSHRDDDMGAIITRGIRQHFGVE